MNHRTLPVLIAVLLTAFGFTAPSYAATIDPEVVAESISEDGYYIDSSAKYLRSDADQDRLRTQLERAKSPVFVAVIPAGSGLSPVQVYHLAKRKGTYAVLSGDSLRAASNTLPAAQVRGAVSQAVRTLPGDPAGAVVAFVGLTNGTKRAPAAGKNKASTAPANSAPADESTADAGDPSQAPAAAQHDGGSPLPLLIGGILAMVLAAGAGYLVYRKARGSTKSTV